MPIDERIRNGLARNADLLPPPVERHLEQVRARRRHRLVVRVGTVAAASALLAMLPITLLHSWRAGPDFSPTERPTDLVGTYLVVGVDERSGRAPDNWKVHVDVDGLVVVDPPQGFDPDVVETGNYEVTEGNRLSTDLFVGMPGCQREEPAVGVYDVTVTAAGLSFERVADDCPAREALFAVPWQRVQ